MSERNTVYMLSGSAAVVMISAVFAYAGAHTWRINEVFTNADGSIQFIELRESKGLNNEGFLAGLSVTSGSGSKFTFPNNFAAPTGNKHILLATQSFADLPGAPTPNHIIPPNFFSRQGDTLTYHVYDTKTFGQLPTDCVNSLTFPSTIAPNSPTNYAGQTGQVDACPGEPKDCPGDLTGSGNVGVADLLALLACWGPVASGCENADLSGDNSVGVADLLRLLAAWGPCPR